MDYKYTISYTLFLYQQEMRRSKSRKAHLKRTKLSLTDKLITKGVRNLKQCSMEDLKVMDRQFLYKKKLNYEIKKSKQLVKQEAKSENPEKETSSHLLQADDNKKVTKKANYSLLRKQDVKLYSLIDECSWSQNK